MDGRINNSGTIGHKPGNGGWPSIDRELWSKLKNEAIKQAYDALFGDDKEFRQKVVLRMLDKISDGGELAGKLELVIKEHDDTETVQTEQLAKEGSAGQE